MRQAPTKLEGPGTEICRRTRREKESALGEWQSELTETRRPWASVAGKRGWRRGVEGSVRRRCTVNTKAAGAGGSGGPCRSRAWSGRR